MLASVFSCLTLVKGGRWVSVFFRNNTLFELIHVCVAFGTYTRCLSPYLFRLKCAWRGCNNPKPVASSFLARIVLLSYSHTRDQHQHIQAQLLELQKILASSWAFFQRIRSLDLTCEVSIWHWSKTSLHHHHRFTSCAWIEIPYRKFVKNNTPGALWRNTKKLQK